MNIEINDNKTDERAAMVGFVNAILTSDNEAAQNVFKEAREIGEQRRWEGADSDRQTTALAQNSICTIAENGLQVGYNTGYELGYRTALAAERKRVSDAVAKVGVRLASMTLPATDVCFALKTELGLGDTTK